MHDRLLIQAVVGFDRKSRSFCLTDDLGGAIVGFRLGRKATAWQTEPQSASKNATLDDSIFISLNLASGDTASAKLVINQLSDSTPASLSLSSAVIEPVRGQLNFHGWLSAPDDGRRPVVEIRCDGKKIGRFAPNLKRPDVVKTHPLLPLLSGVRGSADLCEESLQRVFDAKATFTAVLYGANGRLLLERPLTVDAPDPDTRALNSYYRLATEKVKTIPTERLTWLLASAAFRKKFWGKGPDTIGWAIRELCVEELIRRGNIGEIWIRLSNGDLVICEPEKDGVLARRYLIEAGDEKGFVDWLAQQVAPGMVTFDIGVAYGVMSRAMARAGAHVLAIEADPDAIDRIKRTNAMLEYEEIDLIEAACARTKGTAQFAGMGRSTVGSGKILEDESTTSVKEFLDEVSQLNMVPLAVDAGSRAIRQKFVRDDVSLLTVPTVSIDDICVERDLQDVGLIKIDIEGGELEAMRGAAQLLDGEFGTPPVVVFEYSTLFPMRGGEPSEMLDVFRDRGWTLWKFVGGKSRGGELVEIKTDKDIPEHDNLVACPPERTLI